MTENNNRNLLMISYLEGNLIFNNDKWIVVSVGGVGYRVFLPSNSSHKIPQIGEAVKIFTYLHGAGKIGVMIELNSETDFVAKNDAFLTLGNDITMHIAAMNPKYLSREEVPATELENEKSIHRTQLEAEGKPADMIEKILEGKMKKYYSEVCLLEQPFIKDEDKTIEQILVEKTSEIGEKISIRRFARFELGEGIEKKKQSFAEEVEEQLG